MAFVKFTEVGKKFTPRVSVHPSGLISFNDGARKKYEMDNYLFAITYLDAEAHTIAFELVNDEDLDGANRLRHIRRDGVDLNGRAFLEHFKLRVKKTLAFRLLRDLDTGWLFLRLDDGEVVEAPPVTTTKPTPVVMRSDEKPTPAPTREPEVRPRGVKAMISELLQD